MDLFHILGVVFWRGFTLYDMMCQCYGNADDLEKGRSMPVHYGSKKLNFFTISSPLGTQLPQGIYFITVNILGLSKLIEVNQS